MKRERIEREITADVRYQKEAASVLESFQVTSENGLTQEQAKAHREQYGSNAFTKEKSISFVQRILESLKEPMVILLLLAAVITLGVNIARAITGGEADFLECVGIFFAISLSVAITVIMEGKSAKAFDALNKMTEDNEVRVIRDGNVQLVSQKEIAAGDIIQVRTGDKMPADARLLESTALMADESALTGESMPVQKRAEAIQEEVPVAERYNMLYSGCFITGGDGLAVVTAVGDHSEFGKIAKELSSTKKSTTPLQEKLASMGKKITIFGAGAAVIVFLVQVITAFFNGTISLDIVLESLITSIILVVAAVPEGLPTIVAVSLAIQIVKMSKQNALVKKMAACETIGCINVICSDKTGTLTENKMTVTQIYEKNQLWKPEDLENEWLIKNFCVNSTADLKLEEEKVQFIGNPTECALLTAAQKAGYVYQEVRKHTMMLHTFPFSSETKNMTVVLQEEENIFVYTKGSPEKILSMCKMEKKEKEEIEKQIAGFQKKACRVIGFAHKQMTGSEAYQTDRKLVESDLIFDGFAAITDPLRADVYEAVKKCKNAGIDIKMLTGDNLVTASAIAADLEILDNHHIAVEAKEIEEMSEKELIEQLPSIRVIARSTPVVKMRVVNALKACGNVVAVTGDGINDAPAIKNADVGIAMGIAGTDVSKEASDIVLLDDSFSTIVKSIQWGRGVYENFQRFIQFQLTVNLSSVLVVLASILSGFAAPFTALQLLWINIIMDGPPALTLGLEPIRNDLMKRQPTRRNASIVSSSMFSRILVNGLFISSVFMAQHWTNFLGGTKEQLPTILFTLFVVFQLFNAFNSRELSNTSVFKNLVSNRLMLCVFVATFGLQVIITQFGGAMFGTVPLSFEMWMKIIFVAFGVILVSEAAKLVKTICSREKAEKRHLAKKQI